MFINYEAFFNAFLDTSLVIFLAFVFAILISIPLALTLVLIKPKGILENKRLYKIIKTLVNMLGVLPFGVVFLLLLPSTKSLIQVIEGYIPLYIYIVPYIVAFIEKNLLPLNKEILQVAKAMGATKLEIIRYFVFKGDNF